MVFAIEVNGTPGIASVSPSVLENRRAGRTPTCPRRDANIRLKTMPAALRGEFVI
jgi:hypothetical protein